MDSAADWMFVGGAKYDNTVDFDSCTPGSGSLLIPAFGDSFSQCITSGFTAGAAYKFGYYFRAFGSGSHQSYCSVTYHSDGACQIDISGSSASALVTSVGAWMAASVNAPAPLATASISVNCSAASGDGYYDRMYLSTTGVY
jgi:hypothetical protein